MADRLTDKEIAEAREVFALHGHGRFLPVAKVSVALQSCGSNVSGFEVKVRVRAGGRGWFFLFLFSFLSLS